MFVGTLMISVFLLIITNAVACRQTLTGLTIAVAICVVFLFLECPFGGPALHPLLVGGAALICLAIVMKGHRLKPRRFLFLSLAGTVVCYGVLSAFAYSHVQEWSKYREKYPLESLETRLAYEHQSNHLSDGDREGRWSLSQKGKPVNSRLETLEEQCDWVTQFSGFHGWLGGRRVQSLAQIHKSNVQLFVESPGFGVFRGMPPASTHWLEVDPDLIRRERASDWKTGKTYSAPSTFLQMHDQNVFDFANPADFGYVKDVRHVAGFVAHGIEEDTLLSPPEKWNLQRLELVSLLKHDTPVVYVSESLPRMKDIDDTKTRPLDAFEKSALAALLAGEDLKVSESDHEIRMVGSVRAIKQCLACHGVERGDLLGAFSYRLGR